MLLASQDGDTELGLERNKMESVREVDYEYFKLIFPFDSASARLAEEMDSKAIK